MHSVVTPPTSSGMLPAVRAGGQFSRRLHLSLVSALALWFASKATLAAEDSAAPPPDTAALVAGALPAPAPQEAATIPLPPGAAAVAVAVRG